MVNQRQSGKCVIVSPSEALVTGGPAEKYERQVQALLSEGHRRVVTDLRNVPHIDSAGVRALVRGYTTTQRLGGSFKLVGPQARVLTVLHITRLDTILEIFDSLETAQAD